MKVLLVGSNFLSAQVFVRLMGFNNTHIIVLSNKDPFGLQNQNNDVHRIFRRYCKNLTYKDLYTGKEFGDPKRNIKISFLFNDYINEPLSHELLNNIDMIINCGSIYDSLYAQINSKDTLHVNTNGLFNLIGGLSSITSAREKNPLFIQMSSINVYGVQQNNQKEITEDDTVPNPRDLLNVSLYMQENMIKGWVNNYDTDYIILRLGTLVGAFTPIPSLVNQAVKALLLQEKSFEVNNAKDSICLLDCDDLGNTLNTIIQLYQEGGEKYDKIRNQVFNLKSDEKEELTVETVVESIFSTAERLPQIGFDHFKQMGIKGMTESVRLKAPKIKYGINSEEPKLAFGKPVSTAKALELLKFSSMKPAVWSLLPTTAAYLLNYVLGDLSDNQRAIYAKMLSLPQIPTMENINKDEINKDVVDVVKDINENIDKSLS